MFFSLLFIISLVGTHFFPFMVWDKFPNTYPETETDYELRVITDDDQELPYDFRATLGVDGVYEPYLTPKMGEEYSYCKNIQILEYLLQRARIYRDQVENKSVQSFVRFPPHGLVNMWTKKELDEHGRFTSIRLYKREIRSSSDGTEIRSITKELVIEYPASIENDCPPRNRVT